MTRELIKLLGPCVDRGVREHDTALINVVGQPRHPRLPSGKHEIGEIEKRRGGKNAFVGRSGQKPQHRIDMDCEGEQEGLYCLGIRSRAKS